MKQFLFLLLFIIPTTLFCQKFSGELIIVMADSTDIMGSLGDFIIEIVDGVETATEVGPKDIGRKREWHRDTTNYIYSKKEIVSLSSFSKSFKKSFFRYFDLKKMRSYNYKLDGNKYQETATFKMEDYGDYGSDISEFKIDRAKTKQIAGFEGFWIEYFFIDGNTKKKIQGYVTDSIIFSIPLLPPKKNRLTYIPLAVSIEQFYLENSQSRKTIFRLISYRKVSKRKAKKIINYYKQEIEK